MAPTTQWIHGRPAWEAEEKDLVAGHPSAISGGQEERAWPTVTRRPSRLPQEARVTDLTAGPRTPTREASCYFGLFGRQAREAKVTDLADGPPSRREASSELGRPAQEANSAGQATTRTFNLLVGYMGRLPPFCCERLRHTSHRSRRRRYR